MSKRHTIEFVREVVANIGYQLISTEYTGAKVKLEYLCPTHGSQFGTFDKLRQGKGCPKCAGKNKTIEDIKELTKDTGYKVASDKYIGAHSKLKFICDKHGLFLASYASISQGHGCPKCADERCGEALRHDINIIRKAYANKGYKLISKEYIDNHTNLDFICPTHGLQQIPYATIRDGGGCDKCARDAKSGNGHHNWSGGVTELQEHIRKHCVSQYHKEIITATDYTCQLSETRGAALEVHHTYAFHRILQDTIDHLELTVKPNIGEYTEDELRNIRDKFSEIQASHESIVLSKPIHKLFHDIYGRKDFTVADFQEFKDRYNNGEFTELLTA